MVVIGAIAATATRPKIIIIITIAFLAAGQV
jgi:hypothetical protein